PSDEALVYKKKDQNYFFSWTIIAEHSFWASGTTELVVQGVELALTQKFADGLWTQLW
ncbi:7574_t:CDS:1, partial [Gigaspora rosea]